MTNKEKPRLKVSKLHSFGPTGISPQKRARPLSTANSEAVRAILKEKRIYDYKELEFFSDIADAIGRFDAFRKLEKQTLPGQSRKNLRRAIRAATRLNESLNQLDGNAWQALWISGGRDLRDHFLPILNSLCRALETAKKFPNRRPTDFPRLQLATQVALIIEGRLGVRATTTKNGLFVSILEIVAAAASRRHTSVQELARAAVHEIKLER